MFSCMPLPASSLLEDNLTHWSSPSALSETGLKGGFLLYKPKRCPMSFWNSSISAFDFPVRALGLLMSMLPEFYVGSGPVKKHVCKDTVRQWCG